MNNRPTPELDQILQNLPKDSNLETVEFWSMGWVAFLTVQNRTFKLVSDKGYIDVYKILDGNAHFIEPPIEQKNFISTTQVTELILQSL